MQNIERKKRNKSKQSIGMHTGRIKFIYTHTFVLAHRIL